MTNDVDARLAFEPLVSRVFRVQDAQGRGPWRPGFSAKWVEDHPAHAFLLPWFQEWPGLNIPRGKHVGCACVSEEQLRLWFTDAEYLRLLRFGFRAVRLDEVQVLAAGSTQCVFARDRALRKGAEPFSLYG
jgi:hypothetical protein